MAPTKGKYTRLVVGTTTWAHEFSGVSNELTVSINNSQLDTTVFQSTATTSISGNRW